MKALLSSLLIVCFAGVAVAQEPTPLVDAPIAVAVDADCCGPVVRTVAPVVRYAAPYYYGRAITPAYFPYAYGLQYRSPKVSVGLLGNLNVKYRRPRYVPVGYVY